MILESLKVETFKGFLHSFPDFIINSAFSQDAEQDTSIVT